MMHEKKYMCVICVNNIICHLCKCQAFKSLEPAILLLATKQNVRAMEHQPTGSSVETKHSAKAWSKLLELTYT